MAGRRRGVSRLRYVGTLLVVAGLWMTVAGGAFVGASEKDTDDPSPAAEQEAHCEGSCEAASDEPATEPTPEATPEPTPETEATEPAPVHSLAPGAEAEVAASSEGEATVQSHESKPAVRAQATAAVAVVDSSFVPSEITIDEGGTVTWTNQGDLPHTVTADDNSFSSNTMQPGDEYSKTFTEAGTFPYYCSFHGSPGGGGMSGVVHVVAAETNDEGDDDDSEPETETESDSDPDAEGTDVGDDVAAGVPNEGLPVTGRRDVTPWTLLGIVLIALGAALWAVPARFFRREASSS